MRWLVVVTTAVAMTVPAVMATVVIPVLVASVVAAVMPPSTAAFVVATLAIAFLMTRDVFTVVPVVLDEIDSLVAGIVFTTMLVPVFVVAWWHSQIERGALHVYRSHHYRLRVDQRRCGEAANIETAVKARLADTDRDADIPRECRGAKGGGDDACS